MMSEMMTYLFWIVISWYFFIILQKLSSLASMRKVRNWQEVKENILRRRGRIIMRSRKNLLLRYLSRIFRVSMILSPLEKYPVNIWTNMLMMKTSRQNARRRIHLQPQICVKSRQETHSMGTQKVQKMMAMEWTISQTARYMLVGLNALTLSINAVIGLSKSDYFSISKSLSMTSQDFFLVFVVNFFILLRISVSCLRGFQALSPMR